jgi:hypothetical protein
MSTNKLPLGPSAIGRRSTWRWRRGQIFPNGWRRAFVLPTSPTTSNAPIVNLTAIRRAKWTEKPLFGGPQGYAEGVSEAFRTVSKYEFSEVRGQGKSRGL